MDNAAVVYINLETPDMMDDYFDKCKVEADPDLWTGAIGLCFGDEATLEEYCILHEKKYGKPFIVKPD